MGRLSWVIVLSASSLLGACATTDHSAALSLGNAGVAATQALSDQTSSMGQTVGELSPWWGVRDALACTVVAEGLRAACLAGATAAPDPAIAAPMAAITDVIAKRKVALDTLSQAYVGFIDLAKYNAGQEATAALATSFKDISAFTGAASALVPGGAAIPAISTTIQNVAGGVVALAADSQQNRQILAASRDLHTANDAMVKGLTLERDATASLLVTLQGERAALGASALAAGLISPTDVLTPVINQAYPGVRVTAAPSANGAVVMAAAQNAMKAQGAVAMASAAKSYDDALQALRALSAQHQKLEIGQPLDLGRIEAEIASLQADIDQLNGAPAKAAAK